MHDHNIMIEQNIFSLYFIIVYPQSQVRQSTPASLPVGVQVLAAANKTALAVAKVMMLRVVILIVMIVAKVMIMMMVVIWIMMVGWS